MPYRILVCGGRDFDDFQGLCDTLDNLLERVPVVICHGDARGADRLAGEWASLRGVSVTTFPANWDRYGKAAGAIRNQDMLDRFMPDIVIAFPGGRGTADMLRRAKAAGVVTVGVS